MVYPTPDADSMLAEVVDRWPWNVHHLKVAAAYFPALSSGAKTFEIRRNDRDYQPGDLLVLWEWTGEGFTGRVTYKATPYVMRNADEFGLAGGWVVMSLEDVYLDQLRPKATS